MKKGLAFVLTLAFVLALAGCSSTSQSGSFVSGSTLDGFSNAVPVEIKDTTLQNCIQYAEGLGYETGDFKKAVLLGEDWVEPVFCDDPAKEELVDTKDIVVIFYGIRCVVDADTGVILGRIPFV